MAFLGLNGLELGNALNRMLLASDISPGDTLSYELAKIIYSYHVLGSRLVDRPITLAQSQQREIKIDDPCEDILKEAFIKEWERLKADYYIADLGRTARIYGISSIIYGFPDVPTDEPIKLEDLDKPGIYFNTFDPLNTSGSLVLNQNPNDPDFQKPIAIRVNGKLYHPSRSCVIQNESPLYIEFTNSTFGYTGRSVFQRALFPLKSYLLTLITDDMIARKAGVIVAKIKSPGSIVNNIMSSIGGQRRNVIKEAEVSNVISIDTEEYIESLNLQNLENPFRLAREDIINNVALAADIPVKLINSDNFSYGFSEGKEDSKVIAQFLDGIRKWLRPAYQMFDEITMRRAWNKNFYASIQSIYPEYENIDYNQAFYRWKNNFRAIWPSLIVEPESELIKVEDVKLRSTIAAMQVMLPELDPNNKVKALEWFSRTISNNKNMFSEELELDIDSLKKYTEEKETMNNEVENKKLKNEKIKISNHGANLTKAPYRIQKKKVGNKKNA